MFFNVSKPVNCKSSSKSVCKIIDNRYVFNPVRDYVVVNYKKLALLMLESISMVLKNLLM